MKTKGKKKVKGMKNYFMNTKETIYVEKDTITEK